jgi:hypothetical protein
MARYLVSLLASLTLIAGLADTASADNTVFNYGHCVSHIFDKSGGTPASFAAVFGPVTENKNEVNAPPGQEGKSLQMACNQAGD